MTNGYIFVRSGMYTKVNNVYKLDKAVNLKERANLYKMQEYILGSFVFVIRVDLDIMYDLEESITDFLDEYGYLRFGTGSKGFFDIKAIDLIIPYLDENRIEYELLDDDEIYKITGHKKIK
jgi:hypothetical protein